MINTQKKSYKLILYTPLNRRRNFFLEKLSPKFLLINQVFTLIHKNLAMVGWNILSLEHWAILSIQAQQYNMILV